MRIRARLNIIVLSILASSLIVGGVVSTFSARQGMTRLAMQHLAFKAEEVHKFAANQWDVLVSNGLADIPMFRDAAQEAIHSYALSMIRAEGEMVMALERDGGLVFSTMEDRMDSRETAAWSEALARSETGWLKFSIGGMEHVGYTFHFEPFDWFVVTSLLSSLFHAEVDELTGRMLLILLVTLLVSAAVMFALAGSMTRPIVALADGMRGVTESRDFKRSLAIETDDEIASAARAFNAMTRELDTTYRRLQEIALGEAEARVEIHDREIEALLVIGRASEYNDQETGLHIVRVGLYTMLLAHQLIGDAGQRRLLYQAAPLHDLGKIAVPHSILQKPGRLTEEEHLIMQTHTTAGHRILKDSRSPSLKAGAVIALTHHERFDGGGYPAGLRGTAIPLFSRILAVADVFDALTSRRPYKEAWMFDSAMELVARERGGQFDPKIADIFLAHRAEVAGIFNMEEPNELPVTF